MDFSDSLRMCGCYPVPLFNLYVYIPHSKSSVVHQYIVGQIEQNILGIGSKSVRSSRLKVDHRHNPSTRHEFRPTHSKKRTYKYLGMSIN